MTDPYDIETMNLPFQPVLMDDEEMVEQLVEECAHWSFYSEQEENTVELTTPMWFIFEEDA